jgi:hypothetical protein
MYKKYATAIEKKRTLHVMFNIEVTLYYGTSRQSVKDVFYQKNSFVLRYHPPHSIGGQEGFSTISGCKI